MADIQSTQLLKTSPLEAMARRKVEQRGPTNVLTFPKDLGAHGMLMRFFEYTYGGIKGSEEIPVAEIMLPLPKQLQDSFKVNVGSDEIGLTGSTVAQAFSPGKSTNAGVNALSSFVKNTAKMGRDSADTMSSLLMGDEAAQAAAMTSVRAKIGQAMDGGSFLARSTLNKIVPDAANGIAVGRGNALNPFATLVFKGVDLKVHNLEWTLSPESEEEARELKKIIRTLQQVTLPKTTGLLTGDDSEFGVAALDRGLLKYPAMVNIYLIWQRYLEVLNLKILPSLIGTGLGSASVINNVYAEVVNTVRNPNSNLIRMIYDVGIIGVLILINSFIHPIKRFYVKKELRLNLLICMIFVVGAYFGHRSVAPFLFLGIMIVVIENKFYVLLHRD